MLIELLGVKVPRLVGVTVGVQRGTVVVDEHTADGADLRWEVDVALHNGHDLRGPFVHGRPGARFLYLSWQRGGEGRFRRAKLMLDTIPPELLCDVGVTGRLALTMPDGSPLCASVRPPALAWSARASH